MVAAAWTDIVAAVWTASVAVGFCRIHVAFIAFAAKPYRSLYSSITLPVGLPAQTPDHLHLVLLYCVSKFLCECMDVVLGADSDDQSQTSDQPWVAGKGVID